MKLDVAEKDTPSIARALLGTYLVHERNGEEITSMITEVEAYDGFDDKASHASRGKTDRNTVMFDQGGVWYVYLCYGVHWMLNLVTGPEDYPAAVLIRGSADVKGPGRLTKHFGIDKRFNGIPALDGNLRIEDRGVEINPEQIMAKPRIGIDYADEWADKPYRFVLK